MGISLLEAFVQIRANGKDLTRDLDAIKTNVQKKMNEAGVFGAGNLMAGMKKGLRETGEILGNAFKGGIGGALTFGGGFALAQAGFAGLQAAVGAITPVLAEARENMRLYLAGVPDHALRATQSIEQLRQTYEALRKTNIKAIDDARRGFENVIQPTVGPFPSFAPGVESNELAAFQKNRDAMGKQYMDAVKRFQSLQFGRDPAGNVGKKAFVEKGINELKIAGKPTAFMRPELAAQFDREVEKANSDVAAAESGIARLDSQIERLKNIRVGQQRTETTLARLINQSVGAANQFVGQGTGIVTGQLAGMKAGLDRRGSQLEAVREWSQGIGAMFGDVFGAVSGAPAGMAKGMAKAAGGDGGLGLRQKSEFVGLTEMSRKIQTSLTGGEKKEERQIAKNTGDLLQEFKKFIGRPMQVVGDFAARTVA